MANPFQVTFNSSCDKCEVKVFDGDLMFADEGSFFCELCALEDDIVCAGLENNKCGKKKKKEYKTCFDCFNEEIKKKKEKITNIPLLEEDIF